MRAGAKASLAACAILLPLALGATWVARLEIELPQPTGPHAVGRAFGSFGDARRVAYTLYYPAEPGTGEVGPYVRDSIAGPLAERDMGAFRYVPDAWSRVQHGARDGAAWSDGDFPLVVFSPGAETQTEYYSSLLVEIASHGFVVAALAHPDVTPFVAYEDATFVESPPVAMPRGEDAARRAFEERIDLVAADVLEAIAHVPNGDAARGHLDGRVAAVGHSLGGAAAAEAAARSANVSAVVDLDGSLGDEARGEALRRPVLFVQDDGYVPPPDAEARRRFADGGAPGAMETLAGASHTTFVTDAGFFEEVRPFSRDGDELGATEAWQVVSGLLADFLVEAFPEEAATVSPAASP